MRHVCAAALLLFAVLGWAGPARYAVVLTPEGGGAPVAFALRHDGVHFTGGEVVGVAAAPGVVGLTLDGTKLRGDVVVSLPTGGAATACRFTLDAVVEGATISGKYAGGRGEAKEVGRVTGAVAAEPAADWPCWRGPHGDGSAPDPVFRLVNDLSKARLVWKSADPLPSNAERIDSWRAGYSSPVVADGRVFLLYYRPHGRDGFEFTAEDKLAAKGRNPTTVWHADDIVHCFDAVTGKTLWTHVDERGLIAAHGKQGGHHTPCAAGGRVYVVGTSGRLYCLDAASGAPVWEAYLKDAYKYAFERSLAGGKSVFDRQGFNEAPCAVDGVVAVGADRANIVGFDASTGKRLWTVATSGGSAGARGDCTIPVIWTHKGARYFIAANTCVEPRTGKVLWRIPDAITTTSPCVTEDYYICSGLAAPKGQKEPAAGSTCFRITPQGAEKLWSLAPRRSPAMGCTDVVCGPYFVQASDDAENSRNAFVVEIATGKQVATIDNTFRKLGYSPLSCQGMVFGGMYTLMHFRVGPDEFREVKVPREMSDWANSCSPALADGRLYFRTNANLVCYDLREAAIR